MMRTNHIMVAVGLLMLASTAWAELTKWNIVPQESSITFTGTQNGSPVTGHFEKFSGEIFFDVKQLSESHARIVVDMNSVSTSYSDFTSSLLASDWFDVKVFPDAIFTAKHFIKTGEHAYQADGVLTIRDKSGPLKLNFNEVEMGKDKAKATGHITIQRLKFSVGTGEWADTSVIQNDVKVDFAITAKK